MDRQAPEARGGRATTETTSLEDAWRTESCRERQPGQTKHPPWGVPLSPDPVAWRWGGQASLPCQTQPQAGGRCCLPRHQPGVGAGEETERGVGGRKRGGGGKNSDNRGVCDTTAAPPPPTLPGEP